ncbi:MAG: catalytic domain [Verrucomicrobia bacterium]|nr:MAG: catalytic domain [Verrucomicrobiota bacterium]
MTHPLLYEVNARQWLARLSENHGAALSLHQVPDSELEVLQKIGVTHLWLMGVWPTGEKSRAQALTHPDLRKAYSEALPDWTDADVLGSPYAVADLRVAESLGGDAGLAVFRAKLASFKIKLILDFVPNHLGLDHEWVSKRPELFVGAPSPFQDSFPSETSSHPRFIAHGKDPYFPGWTDTVQLEYRRVETREAMASLVLSLTKKCDGVRCDMAMLLLSEIFERTWAHVPFDGPCATGEFWQQAITSAKQARPDFLFLAEAYWGLEGRLCDLGFDYAYDKSLYDFIVHDHPFNIQPHLLGLANHNANRAHFLENHDEPRISTEVPLDLHRAAVVLALGLPGMRFLHDGQLEGVRRFARVQLARSAKEPIDTAIQSMYGPLLAAFSKSAVGQGEGRILSPFAAWENNHSFRFFTIVLWRKPDSETHFDLVVVNMAQHPSQCRVHFNPTGLSGKTWQLTDRIGTEVWTRDGRELAESGLFLDLPPRGAQLFALAPVSQPSR